MPLCHQSNLLLTSQIKVFNLNNNKSLSFKTPLKSVHLDMWYGCKCWSDKNCSTSRWTNATCVCSGYNEGWVQKVPLAIFSGNLARQGNTEASFLALISLPFYWHPPVSRGLRVGWCCTGYLVSFFIDRQEKREGKQDEPDAGRSDSVSEREGERKSKSSTCTRWLSWGTLSDQSGCWWFTTILLSSRTVWCTPL